MQHLVTRESFQALIDGPHAMHVIGRALVHLFNRQTEDEKRDNTTNHDNARGFTSADGRSGVLSAKSYIKRGTLEAWQVERWSKKGKNGFSRLAKYWAQIDEVARHRAEKKEAA